MRSITQQTIIPAGVIDDDALYSCKIIAQLQGSYEIKTLAGCLQVTVILPEVAEQEEQYATVHRVSTEKKALPEQRIYEEPFWFSLKSANGNLEGVFRKGMNMKHSLKWQSSDDKTYTVWRRKGEVKFNLVHVKPRVRGSPISSVRTDSSIHTVLHSVDTAMQSSDDSLMIIRPELRPLPINGTSNCRYTASENVLLNRTGVGFGAPRVKSAQYQEEMFELIKAHCSQNPILFKKIFDWSIRNNPARGVSQDKTKGLSEGRIWIVAQTLDADESRATLHSLDEIKGAYQEVSEGVWMQPDPKTCGSEVQHRLSKDEHELWMIEQYCFQSEGWQIRARQVEGSRWVDLMNSVMTIRVQIVPMSRILERLSEKILESKIDVKKTVDYLYTSCNHLKLCKVKGHNLKHRIDNLKVKLEKRNALSFGVHVANAAESITQDKKFFEI